MIYTNKNNGFTILEFPEIEVEEVVEEVVEEEVEEVVEEEVVEEEVEEVVEEVETVEEVVEEVETVEATYDGTSCTEVTVYETEDYSGDYLVIEAGDSVDCFTWEPKSVCVPHGKKITFYESCDYADDTIEFTESNNDLPGTLELAEFGEFLKVNTKKDKKVPYLVVEWERHFSI